MQQSPDAAPVNLAEVLIGFRSAEMVPYVNSAAEARTFVILEKGTRGTVTLADAARRNRGLRILLTQIGELGLSVSKQVRA